MGWSMEDSKAIYDYKFENIDKCIGKIDKQLEDHEERIQASEKARGVIFEKMDTQTKNIDSLTKVLWFVGAGMFGSMIAAIMQLILK